MTITMCSTASTTSDASCGRMRRAETHLVLEDRGAGAAADDQPFNLEENLQARDQFVPKSPTLTPCQSPVVSVLRSAGITRNNTVYPMRARPQ